jgi:hypothetical protein
MNRLAKFRDIKAAFAVGRVMSDSKNGKIQIFDFPKIR